MGRMKISRSVVILDSCSVKVTASCARGAFLQLDGSAQKLEPEQAAPKTRLTPDQLSWLPGLEPSYPMRGHAWSHIATCPVLA